MPFCRYSSMLRLVQNGRGQGHHGLSKIDRLRSALARKLFPWPFAKIHLSECNQIAAAEKADLVMNTICTRIYNRNIMLINRRIFYGPSLIVQSQNSEKFSAYSVFNRNFVLCSAFSSLVHHLFFRFWVFQKLVFVYPCTLSKYITLAPNKIFNVFNILSFSSRGFVFVAIWIFIQRFRFGQPDVKQ